MAIPKAFRPWTTPYGGGTWRRIAYLLLGLPVGVAGVVLALTGQARLAAGWQRRLGVRLADLPDGAPRSGTARVLAQSAGAVVLGTAGWLLAQWTAFILLINLAYPWRDYLIAEDAPDNAPLLPWMDLSIHHPAHVGNIWASTYATSWGGPTLAGAWAVQAGLCLLVLFPVVAWLLRGLARLARGLTGRLLLGPAATVPVGAPHRDRGRTVRGGAALNRRGGRP